MANRIVTNSVLNAAAGMSLLLFGFACSIVTARLLGPEANGIIAFSLWIAVTSSLLAELGTGVTLLRILPKLKGDGFDAEARRGFAARMLRPVSVATLVFLAFYLLFFAEADEHHWASTSPSVVHVTAILIVIQSIGSFSKNYLIGEQRVGTFFKMSTVAGLLQFSGVIAGAVFFGIPGAVAGYVLGFVVQFLYALGILFRRGNDCGISNRYLVNSSLLLSIQFLIDSVFLNRIELLFIQQYNGVEVVGYYAAALSLANLALQLPVQLTGSLLPYYSETLQSQGGGRLAVSVFESVARNLAYITMPLSFGLAVIAPRLVTTVFGEAFEPAGSILTVLALGAPIFVFCLLGTQYMFSLDFVRQRLVVGIVGAALMIAGSFVLVPLLGGEGAAIVRFIVFLAMTILIFRKIEFDGSMIPMFLSLGRVAVAAASCAGSAYVVLELVSGLGGLILAIIAGAITYLIALRVVRAIAREDLESFEKIARRLPRPALVLLRFLVAKPGRQDERG